MLEKFRRNIGQNSATLCLMIELVTFLKFCSIIDYNRYTEGALLIFLKKSLFGTSN